MVKTECSIMVKPRASVSLTVAWSYCILYSGRRRQRGARAPLFEIRRTLAYVTWVLARLVSLCPASGLCT
jgi:hypothetical protein